MKSKLFAGALLLAAAPIITAPAPLAQGAATKAPEQQVTVTGCIQRETDYRKAHDKGRAGVAGTGLGADNEFVLTNVSMTGASTGAAAAYELTGSNEKMAAGHVGHRVEISGKLKAEDVTAAGKPTGGATAGKPPSGVDVLSKDLQLRELDVATVKMVSADCK
jgi:hypothetical protein